MRTWSWLWRRPFLTVACEQLDQTVEGFKKSTVAGHAPGGRVQPGVERGSFVRTGPDDAPKLLRPPERAVPAGGGPGVGAGAGAGRTRAATAPGSPQALSPDWARTQSRRRQAGAGPAVWRVGAGGGCWWRASPAESAQNHAEHGSESAGIQEPDQRATCSRGPNQVWVADITYIRTQEAFLYLGLITDQWSRKIVGYHLGQTLETASVLKALRMALKGLAGPERPIHHSDRGCQYASHAYVRAVRRVGLTMSMTEQNHSAANALAERVNGILKQEYWLV